MPDASDFLDLGSVQHPYLRRQPGQQDDTQPQPQPQPQNQLRARNASYNWIRYAVYFWLFRLGLGALGSLISFLLGAVLGSVPALQDAPESALLQEGKWESFQSNTTGLKWVLSQRDPFVFHGIQVPTPSVLQVMIRGLAQTHSISVKVQSDPLFRYFSKDRYWSEELSSLCTYKIVPLDAFIAAAAAPADDNEAAAASARVGYKFTGFLPFSSTPMYVYASFPGLLPYLEGFAPALHPLHREALQAQLWLSSPGVRADWHYDSLDNLLLQLSGSKDVQLISPQGCDMQLWPSLHPFYRQGRLPAQHKCSVHTVRLQAGDMLFLPSGHWHAVHTGQDSVSLNLWLPSAQSQLEQRLRAVRLPFPHAATPRDRLARLGAMAAGVCKLLDRPRACLADELSRRLQLASPPPREGDGQVDEVFCTAQEVARAEASPHSQRSGREVFALVADHVRRHALPPDTALGAVADLVEEAVVSAVEGRSARGEGREGEGGGGEGRGLRRVSVPQMAALVRQCFPSAPSPS